MLGHRVNSEGLRGRANAPRRRRTQEGLYRVRSPFLSTFPSAKTERNRQYLLVFAVAVSLALGFAATPVRHAKDRGVPANSLFIRTQRRTAATFVKRSLRNPSGVANRG
jgi:hypothetical protein